MKHTASSSTGSHDCGQNATLGSFYRRSTTKVAELPLDEPLRHSKSVRVRREGLPPTLNTGARSPHLCEAFERSVVRENLEISAHITAEALNTPHDTTGLKIKGSTDAQLPKYLG